MPKIALGVTSESKHSHNSDLWKATFVLRVRLLGCSFTGHFESNFEKAKRTVHKIKQIRYTLIRNIMLSSQCLNNKTYMLIIPAN